MDCVIELFVAPDAKMKDVLKRTMSDAKKSVSKVCLSSLHAHVGCMNFSIRFHSSCACLYHRTKSQPVCV
jgi:hypothetical protein